MPTDTPTWDDTKPLAAEPTWDSSVPTWDNTQAIGPTRREQRRDALQAQQAEARREGVSTSVSARLAAGIEQGLRTPEVMVRGGLDALQYYRALDALKDVGVLPPAPAWAGGSYQRQNEGWLKAFRDRDEFLAREAQAIEGRDERNFTGDLVQGVARGVVELPPQLMAGAAGAVRNAAVTASAVMGGLQGGLSQYGQERGEGRSQLEALPLAVTSGLITAVTTRAFGATGVESVFRNEGAQGFRRRLVAVLREAGLEGAEELADQMQQDLLERIARNPGKSLDDSLYDTLLAFGVGTAIGGVATSPRLLSAGPRPSAVQTPDGRTVVVNQETGGTDFGPLDELPDPDLAPPPPTARPETVMETRTAPDLGLERGPREPAVSPDLADAIAAVRAGYNPEVPAPLELTPVEQPALPEVPGVPEPLEGQPYDLTPTPRPAPEAPKVESPRPKVEGASKPPEQMTPEEWAEKKRLYSETQGVRLKRAVEAFNALAKKPKDSTLREAARAIVKSDPYAARLAWSVADGLKHVERWGVTGPSNEARNRKAREAGDFIAAQPGFLKENEMLFLHGDQKRFIESESQLLSDPRGQPALNASAVEAFGVKLPEGYVREGDLYVFRPSPTPNSQLPTPRPALEAPQVESPRPKVEVEVVPSPILGPSLSVIQQETAATGSRYFYLLEGGRPWVVRLSTHQPGQTRGGMSAKGMQALRDMTGVEYPYELDWRVSDPEKVTSAEIARVLKAVSTPEFLAEESNVAMVHGLREPELAVFDAKTGRWGTQKLIALESGSSRTMAEANQIQTESRMVEGGRTQTERHNSVKPPAPTPNSQLPTPRPTPSPADEAPTAPALSATAEPPAGASPAPDSPATAKPKRSTKKAEVKPAEVRPAEPGEQAAPPAQAAPAMQEGMDNLRFTSEPVKTSQGFADAKDAKAKLIAELEKAVAQAKSSVDYGLFPNRKTGLPDSYELEERMDRDGVPHSQRKVTIEIPGDGTFTVWNTKEQLGEVLARARRLQTSSKSSWEGPSNPRRSVSSLGNVIADAERVYGPRRAVAKLREQAANMDLEMAAEQRDRLVQAADSIEANLPENLAREAWRVLDEQIAEVNASLDEKENQLQAALAEEKAFLAQKQKRRAEKAAAKAKDLNSDISYDKRRLKELQGRKAESEAELAKELAEAGRQPAPTPTEGASGILPKLDAAIDALKSDPTKLSEGVTGLPVWLSREALRGALIAVRAAIKAGQTFTQALQAGVRWLQAQNLPGFNAAEAEAAVRQAAQEDESIPTRAHAAKWTAQGPSPAVQAYVDAVTLYEPQTRAEWQAKAEEWLNLFGNDEWAAAEFFKLRRELPGAVYSALGINLGLRLNAREAQARAAGDTAQAAALAQVAGDFTANFIEETTDMGRALNALGMLSLTENMSPFAADVFARRSVERAGRQETQRVKPTVAEVIAPQLDEANRAGINETAADPQVQRAAATAINAAIEAEAEQKGTEVEQAVTLEASNSLERLPSVVRKVNEAVVRAWHRLGESEQVRQQTGRAGQALENSIWSAVKQRGGAQSTVASVIAQVNRALHEQLNRALGVKPEQFVNPATYLMRLRDALGNAEVMARVWEQTRAAVGNNLAAIPEMERLLERIEAEIAGLQAQAKQPLAGGPEVTAQEPKLRAQQQAARDAMLEGRNAGITEAIRQRRERIAEVAAQLAEYRKLEPAWRAVLDLTVDVWGPTLVRGLLREQMKADGFRLSKATADHFRGLAGAVDPLKTLGTLRDKIIAASGLDEAAAGRLAQDLEKEYKAQHAKVVASLEARRAKARERAAKREAEQPARDADALIDGYERRQTEWLKPPGRKSAVRAIVRQALRVGASVAGLDEQTVRAGLQAHLEAVGVPTTAAYRLAYEVWQARQASGGGLDAVVAGRIKALQLNLGGIVRWHWRDIAKGAESLAQQIAGETKMPAEQAERLAAAVERVFKAKVQARKQRILDNLAKTPTARRLQRPGVAQAIIEHSNLGTLDSEQLWQVVAAKLGLPTYTAADSAEVKRRADVIQQLPEGSHQRRKATAELLNYIARRKGVKRLDIAWGIWYGNVLSHPFTFGVNLFDTGLNALASTAAVLTTDPGAAPLMARQLPRATRKGVSEAREVWRTGQDLRTHTEGDTAAGPLALYDRKEGFGPAVAWLYSHVGRAMTASDVFWQQGAREMKSVWLARRIAKEEGLTGAALRQRTEEILNNTTARRGALGAQLQQEADQMRALGLKPDAFWLERRTLQLEEELRSPEMNAQAQDFAARTAYNNQPYGLMGALTRSIELGASAMEREAEKTGNQNVARVASLMRRFVIPFTRIPGNVWNERLNYTPFGLLRGSWALLRPHLPFTDGKARLYGREVQPGDISELMVKGAAGTLATSALLLAALRAVDDDDEWQLNGAGPLNGEHRKRLRDTGWTPFSFKIGDRYVSYANSPFAAALAMVGNYVDRHRYKDSDAEGALGEVQLAAMGAVQVFEQQTYLDAVSRTLGLLDNANEKTMVRLAEVLGRGGASFVPFLGANALRGADRFGDRQVYPARDVEDALLMGFPYVRRIGQPALNVFGEPVTLDPWSRFTTQAKQDVLLDLVKRRIYPTLPHKVVNKWGREMTDDEHYRYVQESGSAVKRRLDTPAMRQTIRSGNEEAVRKAVTGIVKEERERVRTRMGF
jgi:hypothetical protein